VAAVVIGLSSLMTGCGGPTADAPSAGDLPPSARTGAKLRAKDVLWGAWSDEHRTGGKPPWDMTPTRQVEDQVGRRMSLLPFTTPMQTTTGSAYFEFPASLLQRIRRHGSIPFFSWSSHRMRHYGDPRFTLAEVIAGRHDAYIRRWARAAKAWGHGFFLRFNWEMNGDWFPWSERYGSNRHGEYVAAWRHVHDIFTAAGATNASWVWCPAADPRGTLQSLRGLYPGDRYVDWTCLDGYNRDEPWMPFADIVGPTYRAIAKIAPSKPMVIGETASTEGGGDKAAWIAAMFRALPARFPKVHGLVWYDARDGGSSPRTDWPLDSSRAATRAFAAGIANPRFRAGGGH
jgi:hypothetical protein